MTTIDPGPPQRRHNGGPPLDDIKSPFGPNGWVAVGRDSRYHPIVGFGKTVPPCDPDRGFVYSRAEAWQDLIMECRYSTGQVFNGGRVMTIERGQLVGATSWLAHRWNWTPKTVRHFLDTIEAAEMAQINAPGVEKPANRAESSSADMGSSDTGKQRGKQKGKQSQVLTICNYGIYQLSWLFKGQAKGQEHGQEKGEQGASKGQARGNIYKEEQGNKGTSSFVSEGSREAHPTVDGPRDGEEEIQPGLFVNCDTVRHRGFSISISSVALQLATANLGLSKNEATPLARDASIAHALQWAADYDAGRRNDIPKHPANFIKGSVIAQRNREAAHQSSMSRGGRPAPGMRPAPDRQRSGTYRPSPMDVAEAVEELERNSTIDGTFQRLGS